MTMKRLLIIGGSGQLGAALRKDASFFGYEVFSPSKKDLDITCESSILEEYVQDCAPNLVINAAAYNLVASSENFPLEAMNLNCFFVANLAAACSKISAPLVTYSTDYVFDGKIGSPYIEHEQPNPLQMYGISKCAGEYAARAYYEMGSIVIRTCGIYGGISGSRQKGGNCVLNFIRQLRLGLSFSVSADQWATPTYAQSVSCATLALLETEPAAGIYHLVNEGHCSWYDFAREIKLLIGSSTHIEPIETDKSTVPARPLFSVLSNAKAKRLGIQLPFWKDALAQYIESELLLNR